MVTKFSFLLDADPALAKAVNDGDRATKALLGVQRKRLKYRDSLLDAESARV